MLTSKSQSVFKVKPQVGLLGAPMLNKVFSWGVLKVMRSWPSLSSISMRLRPPVWMTFRVWLPLVTGFGGVCALGDDAGDDGPVRVAAEEGEDHLRPLAQGEMKTLHAAACGCIMRTQVDALPSLSPPSSNLNLTL